MCPQPASPARRCSGRQNAQVRRLGVLAALAGVPLLVLVVFFLHPVLAMVETGFRSDGQWQPGAVLDVLTRPRVHRVLGWTLGFAVAGTLGSLLVGLPAAYALHRLALPGRRIVRALLLVPFVMPTVVVGAAFSQLLGEGGPLGFLGWTDTPMAIICGLVWFNAAVVIRLVGSSWETLDPRPGEAAAALGATPLAVLRTVTWPQLRPSIASAASVVFLFCATAFGVVLTLGGVRYSTVETEIYLLTTSLYDLPAAAALSVLQLALVVGLLLVSARMRRHAGPVQRRVVAPRRLRRTDAATVGATAALLVFITVPMVSLVTSSLRRDGEWGLGNYRALTHTSPDSALLVPVSDAWVTSLRVAVDATWIALLLGLLVSLALTRRVHRGWERRLLSALDGAFMLPLGVSAVTLGFGFMIALDTPPLDLRNSALLIPLAQALVALPIVVRSLTPLLAGIDDRQRQAAATLGAGPLRRFLVVDVPVLWKPLLASAGFAFAASLGEFGATSFLVRDEAPTLPIVIFRLLGQPGVHNYGMAMAGSVLLAATVAGVMVLVERLRVPGVGTL